MKHASGALGAGLALVAGLAAAPVTFGPEPSRAARTRPPALAGSWYPEGRAHLVAGAHFLMRLAAAAPAPARQARRPRRAARGLELLRRSPRPPPSAS